MTDETVALAERWMLTFCEAPPLLDAELMRAVLADHEQQSEERAA
ncbi:hypothetical protein [Brevundimonas balnearis]|uniref:Uncharacterized protein n=1 Tax=Brevundimonas balnearis TaxID=1572858 RepID=A0ABV6R494_9CAUL